MARIFGALFLAFVVIQSAAAQCPEVIPRAAWAARRARFVPVLPIRPAPFFIIHPLQRGICGNPIDCGRTLREIQDFHMISTGWADISYHFMMGADVNGYRIYEGRGWGRIGENVGGFTNQAISIGLIGGFSTMSPSVNATNFVNSFIECGVAQGFLARTANVLAQCQVTNIVSCAATTVFDWVSGFERFTSNPRLV